MGMISGKFTDYMDWLLAVSHDKTFQTYRKTVNGQDESLLEARWCQNYIRDLRCSREIITLSMFVRGKLLHFLYPHIPGSLGRVSHRTSFCMQIPPPLIECCWHDFVCSGKKKHRRQFYTLMWWRSVNSVLLKCLAPSAPLFWFIMTTYPLHQLICSFTHLTIARWKNICLRIDNEKRLHSLLMILCILTALFWLRRTPSCPQTSRE